VADDVVIKGEAVRKTYGGVEALGGVDFAIGRGEVVGLAGDNGAGKSTLLKIIAGAVKPTHGSLEVDGESIAEFTPAHARAHGIEIVYQDLALCDNLDVRANIFLGRELKGRAPLKLLRHEEMLRRSHALLRRLEIRVPSIHEPVSALSGGQRQAVAICRALAFEPKVILLDEPTAALSVNAVAPLLELIRRLPLEGATVILVSHRMSDLFSVTDRIYVFRTGRLVADVRTKESNEREILHLMAGLDATGGDPPTNGRSGLTSPERRGGTGDGESDET
jgi:ABC-type sugar transport system ATPase subunit